MKVNGRQVKGIAIAYDDCHKIYVCKNRKEVHEARGVGYEIYGISSLPKIWENSCPLRFISQWDLTDYYVQQAEDAVFEEE